MAILPAWLWDKDSSTANSFTCQQQNALGRIAKHWENLAGFSRKMWLSMWSPWRAPGTAVVFLQLQEEVGTHWHETGSSYSPNVRGN